MSGMTTGRWAAAVALAVGVGACSDDPTGPANDLTLEEAERAFDALSDAGLLDPPTFDGAAESAGPGERIAMDAAMDSESFTEQVGCPQGGSATWDGTVSGGEEHMDAAFAVTYDACEVPDGEGGTTVVDGTFQFDLSATFSDDSFEMDGSLDGVLDFSGSIEGSCGIDLAFHVTEDGTPDMEGHFCGHSPDDWSV